MQTIYLNHLIYVFLTPLIFQIGTCAMKAREQGGVVDERLNVYGVQNLKVAGKYLPFFLFWKKEMDINVTLYLQIAVLHLAT